MRPLLLGHRGARKYSPENTLPALQMALDHGCDGFEFDVRMTADMHAVICHDPQYLRKVISESRRSELDVPTLEEVITRFSGKAFLNIELKVSGTESCTAELLRLHPFRGIVSSFLPEVIEKMAALKTDIPLGLICESTRQLARRKDLPIRAVMAHRGLLSQGLIMELQAERKQVFAWTVNRAAEMKKFADWGVAGLISDDTRLLAATFPS